MNNPILADIFIKVADFLMEDEPEPDASAQAELAIPDDDENNELISD